MHLWPVEQKVFNWSEVHLSEVTSYKIHTLMGDDIETGRFKLIKDWIAKRYMLIKVSRSLII